jgi:DnaK suppressor protein
MVVVRRSHQTDRVSSAGVRDASLVARRLSSFLSNSKGPRIPMTTDVGQTQHLTEHEARQRLEHERNSRLAQLRTIEDGASYAKDDLQTAQTAAIRRIVEEIDAAAQRLADGSYGTCTRCRRAIPVERLEILPYFAFCVACQQRAI